ncbi:type III secretion system rspB [Pseudomonas yamanorum]|nr:type III secretion system rspB [Pseudomonas yamanorum]
MKAFNTSDSEKEKLNYSTELSNTMLLTQVLTKGVGKTVQLVEKITNLQ